METILDEEEEEEEVILDGDESIDTDTEVNEEYVKRIKQQIIDRGNRPTKWVDQAIDFRLSGLPITRGELLLISLTPSQVSYVKSKPNSHEFVYDATGNNIDCFKCDNCSNCASCRFCSNCENCSNCTLCSSCFRCNNCRDCDDCFHCNNCKFCIKCIRCEQCEEYHNLQDYYEGEPSDNGYSILYPKLEIDYKTDCYAEYSCPENYLKT